MKKRRELSEIVSRVAVYKCGCRRQVVGYPAEVYKEIHEAYLWPCPVCSPICRPLVIADSSAAFRREDIRVTFKRPAAERAAAGAEQQELF